MRDLGLGLRHGRRLGRRRLVLGERPTLPRRAPALALEARALAVVS
jgi:hypothetical protein